MDPPGIEPGFSDCQPDVFPLDHEPPTSQRSVRESNPTFVLTKDACCHSTYRPLRFSDPGWNRTITFLHVAQVSSPLDHGIKLSVTEVGVEPTGTRFSTSSLCQFAYPVIGK